MVLPACIPRVCSNNDHRSTYDIVPLRRKFLLLLDVLRFLAAALLGRLGVVSCHDNVELPGEPWCVDTAAMERLMETELIRTSRYYRLRRRRASWPGRGDDGNGSEAICAICLAALETEGGGGCRAVVVELSGCSHAFHAACINGWVGEAGTCPLCRTPVMSPW
uniref:RING-type domain-containing protein n=1 Tax=Leersia perrieri TaxID=77586 RepID=A0A0D9W8J5_9ORYZ